MSKFITTNLWCFFERVNKGNKRKQHRKGIVVFSPLFASQERKLDSDKQVDWVANVKADREQLYQHIDTVVIDTKICVLVCGGKVYIPKSE
jgi:hypothetical protein